MAQRFVDKRTHRFYFDDNGTRRSYVLTYGDQVNTLTGAAPSGSPFRRVSYRGRFGEWRPPALTTQRSLEMYFLDVGQGDAAFVVTPNNSKILVDGGLRRRALAFLIWKYRLDRPQNLLQIDHLFLSHADKDHVEGLIPLLDHPQITVRNIHHNGIGLFNAGQFQESIGDRSADGTRLVTLHNTTADLNGLALADSRGAVFRDWIRSVRASGAHYRRRDRSTGHLDVGDNAVDVEILGPNIDAANGGSCRWLRNKAHTINGHSLVFRLTHGSVRTFFSGDLNEVGSEELLALPNAALGFNSHVFKSPHHGSHEFSETLFQAVNPMITVVSSGEIPDHGHPRASFLAAVGRSSRAGADPLLFSTAVATLFADADDAPATGAAAGATTAAEMTFDDLSFATSAENAEARRRFKKLLPGIINVRSDGSRLFAFRRVQQGYAWESYGPIVPVQ